MLRETGTNPTIVSAQGTHYAADIREAKTFSTRSFTMPNRIVPALMLLPKVIYHGAGLGEVHETIPWHQYMDISTPEALDETTQLLRSIGVETTFQVPLVVMPYNLTQKVLAVRYPDLYAHQLSVKRNSEGFKTLHVALGKMYHGLEWHDVCDAGVLQVLASRFMQAMTDDPDSVWGYHRNYEIIALEIRALLHRVAPRGGLQLSVPPEWDEPWIDSIHTYTNPSIEDRFLRILREHAEELDLPTQLPDSLMSIADRSFLTPRVGPS